MPTKPIVLFLCTGNSCRSQMAEGFLRHTAGDRFEVYSAGSEPKEEVHPLAIHVMAESGIDISDHRPKHVGDYLGRLPVRHLIVVCGGANENCPRIFPGMQTRTFWNLDDPAAFVGSDEDTLDEFRRIRDEIETRIKLWVRDTVLVERS